MISEINKLDTQIDCFLKTIHTHHCAHLSDIESIRSIISDILPNFSGNSDFEKSLKRDLRSLSSRFSHLGKRVENQANLKIEDQDSDCVAIHDMIDIIKHHCGISPQSKPYEISDEEIALRTAAKGREQLMLNKYPVVTTILIQAYHKIASGKYGLELKDLFPIASEISDLSIVAKLILIELCLTDQTDLTALNAEAFEGKFSLLKTKLTELKKIISHLSDEEKGNLLLMSSDELQGAAREAHMAILIMTREAKLPRKDLTDVIAVSLKSAYPEARSADEKILKIHENKQMGIQRAHSLKKHFENLKKKLFSL